MKLILGDDWEDQPLSKLVAEHPELRRLTVQDLIALHEGDHEHAHEPSQAAAAEPAAADSPMVDGLRAIEDGKGRQTAEDWLKDYLREHDGSERED